MTKRLVFRSGYQKKLIEQAKHEIGCSWKGLAKLCEIKEGTIRNEWRHEKTTMSSGAFDAILRASPDLAEYEKYIMERRHPFWGSKKAAASTNRMQGTKISIPERGAKLSELIGIILGDGCLYSNENYGIYDLRIVGDIREKEYLSGFAASLIRDLFGVTPKIYKFKNENAVCLKVQSRRLIDYFRDEQGLIPGNKIRNRLTIPAWIKGDKECLKACIRGLIDTDGSVFRLSKKDSHLLRISFKNHNKKLLSDVRKALIDNGYNPSKITHNAIFITRQDNIFRYCKEIGFNNPKHKEKVRNSPVV